MKHTLFKFSTFTYWSFLYRGGKDFDKARKFIRLVANKKHCNYSITLCKPEFFLSSEEVSIEEKMLDGLIQKFPFSVSRKDNKSTIAVSLYDKRGYEEFFYISPNNYVILSKNPLYDTYKVKDLVARKDFKTYIETEFMAKCLAINITEGNQ